MKPWTYINLGILLCVLSCSRSNDGLLVKLQSIQHINYELSLVPTSTLVHRELSGMEVSEEYRDSLEKYYAQSRHFLLKIYPDEHVWDSKANDFLAGYSGTFENFRENLEELLYNAGDRAALITGQDTLKPMLFHCERGYELKPEQRLMFVFPNEKTGNEDLTFLFKDDLFDNGLVKFHFDNQESEQ